MNHIDDKTVHHMASLAKIKLSHEESRFYKEQLGEILDFMEQLKNVDTEGISLSSNKTHADWREDRVGKSLPGDDVLHNAPASHQRQYKVDGFLENE